MAVNIEPQPDGGSSIRVEWAGLGDKALRISIMDRKTRQFLVPSGWSRTRKTLAEVAAASGVATFALPIDVVAHIKPSSKMVIEDVFLGFREEAVWPSAPLVEPEPLDLGSDFEIDLSDGDEQAPVAADVDTPTPPPAPAPILSRPRRWAIPAAIATGALLVALAIVLVWRPAARDNPSEVAGQAQQGPEARVNVPSPTAAPDTALPDSAGELQSRISAQDIEIAELKAQLLKAERERSELKKQVDTKAPTDVAAAATPSSAGAVQARVLALEQELQDLKIRLASAEGERDKLRTAIGEIDTLRAHVASLGQELFQARQERDAALAAAADASTSAPVDESDDHPEMGLWGAAADKGRTIEVSYNGISRDAAVGEAIRKCQAAQSPGECEIISVYRNECFAVARPTDEQHTYMTYGTGKGPNMASAIRGAMQDCGKVFFGQCFVAIKVCSPETLAAN